jgi:curved DNA-binding protein
VDLSDILNAFRSGRNGAGHASGRFSERGEDYEIPAAVSIEKIYAGGEIDVAVELPDYDEHGLPHRVAHTFRITVPKDAADGQRMRLAGKGGPGIHGGKPGDLYVILKITPHPLYRISGRDLYLDLKLSPWEAVLGASVKITTPGGAVELKVKPGSTAGQHLRLTGRGLPRAKGSQGDLYAVLHIEVPAKVSKAEQELYVQLAAVSEFNPRTIK